jgi:1,4-alpha-glucan branching enzyme
MNAYYLTRPCLWEVDDSWDGFQWLCVDDRLANTIVFLRKDAAGRALLVACNFSGAHHRSYRAGVPFGSTWTLDFSTDAGEFGGGNRGNSTPVKTESVPDHGHPQSLLLDLPPMTCAIYRCVRRHPIRKAYPLKKPRKKLPAKKAES